jgi:hypothetical protein
MRRAVCILILVSMTLHCATRLGMISYLYSKRHQVALAAGLIQEIPITLCKSDDYRKSTPLVIINTDLQDQNLPIQFTHTSEINLFFESANTDILRTIPGIAPKHSTLTSEKKYTPPALLIFHPPC